MARKSRFFTPESIARRLTVGQRNTILHMGTGYAMLGCSAPIAFRLCNDKVTRPALVRAAGIGGVRHYALTTLGLAVRAALSVDEGERP